MGKSDGTGYVIGLSGAVLDELNNGQWRRSEVDVNGRHLATVTSAKAFFPLLIDWARSRQGQQ